MAKDGRKVSFGISCGKDSAVMLELVREFLGTEKHSFFFLSHFETVLPFKKRYLNALERRYGIKVDVFTAPEKLGLRQAPALKRIRDGHGAELTGMGYKIYDSLQRRAILKGHDDGIVPNSAFFCPLRDWTNRQCLAYARSHRLVLSPEYSLGCQREMADFFGPRSVVLRHLISEEDFQCAASQDKRILIDYERFKDDPELRYITERVPRAHSALAD